MEIGNHAIEILFEDDDILVVNKPAGLDSQLLQDYLSKTFQDDLFVANRLDQRVSGVMVVAKTKAALAKLNDDFANRRIKKLYRAVVANQPPATTAELVHWLRKDESKAKAFNSEVAHSKKAVLSYKVIQSSQKYHLLQVELFTGRFHQIRAQLAAIHCPIFGDIKYGYKRTSPDGSIFLQSYSLELLHPVNQQPLSFQIEIPDLWKKYGF